MSTSFEPADGNNNGLGLYIKTRFWDTDTDNPVASRNFASPEAARTGSFGLLLDVTVPSSAPWHVMLIAEVGGGRGLGAGRARGLTLWEGCRVVVKHW